eukprot:scaffold121035_cov57-Phaeocystis_antarctica.AAC.5
MQLDMVTCQVGQLDARTWLGLGLGLQLGPGLGLRLGSGPGLGLGLGSGLGFERDARTQPAVRPD